MKKTYDWSIRMWITITNNQRKLQVVSSIHTNVHQLKIQIAKILSLPILDTHIEIYFRDDRPLKATSTLLQNQIQNNSHLSATITRAKQAVTLGVESKQEKKIIEKEENYQPKGSGKIDNVGLSVVSSCTNPKCVNYNQKIEINFGFGVFPILSLTSFAKCQICPYKSQHLRPNMLCHQVRIQKCYYQLKGTSLDSNGIPVAHNTNFLKSLKQKSIQKLLSDNPWHIDMELIVKPL